MRRVKLLPGIQRGDHRRTGAHKIDRLFERNEDATRHNIFKSVVIHIPHRPEEFPFWCGGGLPCMFDGSAEHSGPLRSELPSLRLVEVCVRDPGLRAANRGPDWERGAVIDGSLAVSEVGLANTRFSPGAVARARRRAGSHRVRRRFCIVLSCL